MSNTAPFGLGKTWYGNDETIDVSSSYANSPGQHLEGRECHFSDVDSLTTPQNPRSSDVRKTRIVRNCSGATLKGGYLVTYGTPGKRVNGMACTTAAKVAGVVDPALGTTGVRDGDLFHLVVDGAVLCKTPLATGEIPTAIAVGDPLFSLTAATSGATTAGRVRLKPASHTTQDGTDTSLATFIGNFYSNVIGVAMSAATSANTNSDILVDLRVEG